MERPVPKTIDIFVCKMNQEFLHKPQHSVNHVVQEERVHDNNIGTQGMQELFFYEVSEIGAFMELFTVMIWLI